jgi:ubiquinone/menaquinone biosynthesis C-methylase UbiE
MASEVRRDIHAIYSRLAFIYDTWTYFTESRSLDLALDSAAIRDGDAVLEVAVGTGIAFREILRRNPSGRNVGVDLTEAMLSRARARAEASGTPYELVCGDARALAFPTATFDVVMNNNMLGLVPQDMIEPILSEMFRVLRPSGRLVIATMMHPPGRFAEVVYRVGASWLGGWRDVEPAPFVRAAGFVDVERQSVTQLGIPTQVLRARKPGSQECFAHP